MVGLLRALCVCLLSISGAALAMAQESAIHAAPQKEELKFVVYLSRHGVRSPTGKPAQYAKYSAAPWPEWSVQTGYLTNHGYQLMKLFGVYDRAYLAQQGLLAASGCSDAAHITILADSDQRTRETGKAIAEGLFPSCDLAVHAQNEGTEDPLFHSLAAGVGNANHALAAAAIAGRIGGDVDGLKDAYRPQLAALDSVLAGCGKLPATNSARTSLFDIPAKLGEGTGDHPAELRGPLATASTLSENLLLEYAEGFSGTDLGWGCLSEEKLREVMQLHAGEADYGERTQAIARMYSSNLLDHILKAIEQSASGKTITDAPGKPDDRVLFLAGHDTNIAAVAGSLGLNWILDGRRDDTPPGGVLVFELWRSRTDHQYTVRTYYTAQTLEQMRTARTLTLSEPPARANLYLPGCSDEKLSCDLDKFIAAMNQAIDPAYAK